MKSLLANPWTWYVYGFVVWFCAMSVMMHKDKSVPNPATSAFFSALIWPIIVPICIILRSGR